MIFELQSMVNLSERLTAKLREELDSASSMLRYHVSQSFSFKKKAYELAKIKKKKK